MKKQYKSIFDKTFRSFEAAINISSQYPVGKTNSTAVS